MIKVHLYLPGQHDLLGRIGSREICIGNGDSSGQEAVTHFGLGKVERVDVEIQLPHGKGQRMENDVLANQ